MSDQALDFRKSVSIVRRHWIPVTVFFLLGLMAGAAYTVLRPPGFSSSALVVLPASVKDVSTQVVVADSQGVLTGALRNSGMDLSLPALRQQVAVRELTPNLMSFRATGTTAREAEVIANGVARSYITYVATSKSTGGNVAASLLQPAVSGTRTPVPVRLAATAAVGALAGGLIGAIGVLAIKRGDRRLRLRDQIADTVGVPVLASVAVSRPKNAAAWAALLEDYEPDAVQAWRFRNALRYLQLLGSRLSPGGREPQHSVTVLSLQADQRALAIGPQLAAFAAAAGISTALVIGPQQDPAAAALLRSVCAVPTPASRRPDGLRLHVADHAHDGLPAGVALCVVVAVVDGRGPETAGMIRTSATVLGVSAGAATAEELARVAARAAADGRDIDGILVADPDPADNTTGRFPQTLRPVRETMPTRLSRSMTETTG